MICTVGLVCLDIVNFMPEYPAEDTDQRCAEQTWARGGNASNSASVLACLGAPVECLGTIADGTALRFLQNDMESLGIKHDNCPIITCGNGPISVIICSKETGSRTIVHAKGNLRELTLHDFMNLNLNSYSWLHFEGRNEYELPRMMKQAKTHNEQMNYLAGMTRHDPLDYPNYKKAILPISLEVELQIGNLDKMLPLADLVFVGKDYAKLQGAKDATQAAQIMSRRVLPGTVVVCPWGEQGASYCVAQSTSQDTLIKHQEAYVPAQIVDSLGAGDTFNATVIYCLSKGYDVGKSVDYACQVASKKLEISGINGIKQVLPLFSGLIEKNT